MGSDSVIVRNAEGVLLRYQVGALTAEALNRPSPPDRLRMALLRAERQLVVLEIIVEHLDLSDLAIDRINWSLRTIRAFLEMERPHFGLTEVSTK